MVMNGDDAAGADDRVLTRSAESLPRASGNTEPSLRSCRPDNDDDDDGP